MCVFVCVCMCVRICVRKCMHVFMHVITCHARVRVGVYQLCARAYVLDNSATHHEHLLDADGGQGAWVRKNESARARSQRRLGSP